MFSLCILLLCSFTQSNKTLVRQKLLWELIAESGNIVVGEIVSVNDSNYTLKTVETLKGKIISSFCLDKTEHRLRWYGRWKEFKTGQSGLFFLLKDEEGWRVFNNHGDAELPIKGTDICVYGRSWVLKKNQERNPENFVDFDNESINAILYNKMEMIRAVKDFIRSGKKLSKKMFEEEDMKYIRSGKLPLKDDVNITDKTLLEFRARSSSHKRLMDELMDEPFLLHY
jgi:hypothetical protein